MLPVSAVIIASNAAETLSLCLQSLRGRVREIVIVINDCTDDTRKIAENFGARVIEHPWEGFGEQRNFAASQAKEAWLLCIDTDEEVTPELCASAEAFFESPLCEQTTACFVKRINRQFGRWCSVDRRLFLVKKAAVHWEGAVHERACFQGQTQVLKGYLRHYTEKNVLHALEKNVRYARTRAADYAKKYSQRGLMIKCIMHPGLNFFSFYLRKRLFLKGFAGFYVSVMQAFFCFLKYLLALELKRKDG
ncbi:MAG: glycosyltransferase family 2 protein [Opitutales bacterium]|nr:glycosyltransferase family 2 protein [Opitutales bacterium]